MTVPNITYQQYLDATHRQREQDKEIIQRHRVVRIMTTPADKFRNWPLPTLIERTQDDVVRALDVPKDLL